MEESIPGKWNPEAWTRYPVVASMATRECLSSAARNQARVESSPRLERRRGSKFLAGAVAPPISSRDARATVLTVFVFYFCCNCFFDSLNFVGKEILELKQKC